MKENSWRTKGKGQVTLKKRKDRRHKFAKVLEKRRHIDYVNVGEFENMQVRIRPKE